MRNGNGIVVGSGTSLRRRSGFTIPEVMIAVGMVTVLFVALYLGISFGFATTVVERENLRATQIMVERIEGFRLFTWEQLLDSSKNPASFTEYFQRNSTNAAGEGAVYTGTVTIRTNVALSPSVTYSSDIMMIDVTVAWTSGNKPHTRTMSTYVSRRGVQNYVYNN